MRILDLGAHDGFVTTWLARQFPDADILVDGVELNEHGASEMNRRLRELSIAGECRVGLAEDAPDLFPKKWYDVVVAFEIIEHVPDVEQFLEACERMLTPGGRIYLSTPDGTFGSGQNPHHLRVYRATDLFDVLRERGQVHDMTVGPDGVIVASYSPATRNGTVAIFTGPGWKPWSPLDIESTGLGGSETAAARLATAMANEGYMVTVYGEVEPMAHDQVSYRHWTAFDPTEHRNIVIASRFPALTDRYVNADYKLLWMHDTDYGDAMTPERVAKFDHVGVLSEWHHMHVLDAYPWVGNLLRLRNGIEPSYFEEHVEGIERNPHRAIYSSSPDRGLDFLLRIWPDVRERVPGAELYYCYSDVYDAVAKSNPQLQAFRAEINRLGQQDGVVNLGSLPQQGVAAAMREAGVWLAPSWCSPHNCRFSETYCIGAVEAAAAGCHLVVSGWGALTERAATAPSALVIDTGNDDGPPNEAEWINGIVEAMTEAKPPGPSQVALLSTWREVALDILDAYAHVG